MDNLKMKAMLYKDMARAARRMSVGDIRSRYGKPPSMESGPTPSSEGMQSEMDQDSNRPGMMQEDPDATDEGMEMVPDDEDSEMRKLFRK